MLRSSVGGFGRSRNRTVQAAATMFEVVVRVVECKIKFTLAVGFDRITVVVGRAITAEGKQAGPGPETRRQDLESSSPISHNRSSSMIDGVNRKMISRRSVASYNAECGLDQRNVAEQRLFTVHLGPFVDNPPSDRLRP